MQLFGIDSASSMQDLITMIGFVRDAKLIFKMKIKVLLITF